jgi:hypothetical protein
MTIGTRCKVCGKQAVLLSEREPYCVAHFPDLEAHYIKIRSERDEVQRIYGRINGSKANE